MKAVVKYDNKDGATELREVAVPVIGDDDVLVEIAYIGVCGSDPHMHHNNVSYKVNVPLILGHEFSGTIKEVGRNIKKFKKGDRVTGETHAEYCGTCEMCRTNNYQVCRERKGFGFNADGAFAKYLKVPGKVIHLLPEGIGLKTASLTEPLCVAYNALVKKSNINPGDLVVVIGPGPIGLLCAKMAEILGATDIVLVGTEGDEKRLEIATQFGATMTLNSAKEDVCKTIMQMKDKYGADVVVDTAGVSQTLKLSMDIVRPSGQITKIGWGPAPVNFSLDPIIQKAVRLQGTFSHTWDVWEKCLDLMSKNKVDLDKLITHELTIDKWEEAFKLIENKEGLKVVLTPI